MSYNYCNDQRMDLFETFPHIGCQIDHLFFDITLMRIYVTISSHYLVTRRNFSQLINVAEIHLHDKSRLEIMAFKAFH